MEEYQPQQTSKYNEAVNQLTRLDFLWQSCNELSTSGNLLTWRWTLDAAWRELFTSAIKLNEQNKKPNEFDERYNKDKSWIEIKKEIQERILQSRGRVNLYKNLSEYEEFLKLLQDTSGKGTKWKENEDDDED